MIADVVAQDSEGRDVLVAVVRGRPLESKVVAEYFGILESLELQCPSIPFGMVVDPEEIHIKKLGCETREGTHCILNSRKVFQPYDPEFGDKRIFQGYLRALVEAWLRDLAYHWKMEEPPGSEQLAAIGLLQRLDEGTTQREVPLGADALR